MAWWRGCLLAYLRITGGIFSREILMQLGLSIFEMFPSWFPRHEKQMEMLLWVSVHSKRGPGVRDITGELVRNAEALAPPQTCWLRICTLISSQAIHVQVYYLKSTGLVGTSKDILLFTVLPLGKTAPKAVSRSKSLFKDLGKRFHSAVPNHILSISPSPDTANVLGGTVITTGLEQHCFRMIELLQYRPQG